MAIAGNEYYDNLDKALKLLASADAQRSTTNSTAGEAMRFYNQFRDSRLSERPALVDTQALLDGLKTSPSAGGHFMNLYSQDNVDDSSELYKEYAGNYYGGMNKPRYLLPNTTSQSFDGPIGKTEQQFHEDSNIPAWPPSGLDPKYETFLESLAPGIQTSDHYGDPRSVLGTTVGYTWQEDENGNLIQGDPSWFYPAGHNLPDYFIKSPEVSADKRGNTATDFVTNIELTEDQFKQAELAMRAGLPLPALLQLMVDNYTADNFRLGADVTGAFIDTRDAIPSNRTYEVQFLDRDRGYFPYSSSSNSLIRLMNKLGSKLQNSPVFGDAYANQSTGSVSFAQGTGVLDADKSAIGALLNRQGEPFRDVLTHEIGHIVQPMGGITSNDEFDFPDIWLEQMGYERDPETNEFTWGDANNALRRLWRDGYQSIREEDSSYAQEANFPSDIKINEDIGQDFWNPERDHISSYLGEHGGHTEPFAEDFRLYIQDKRQGWIGEADGRKYTFAELFPNRSAFMDTLFTKGYENPQDALSPYSQSEWYYKFLPLFGISDPRAE